jgi:hypothetical protein
VTKRHAFEPKLDENGYPVVAQVKGEPEGAMAQVCDVCGETAGANGIPIDHQED